MSTKVCPASHAGFLVSSLRKWLQNPEKILGDHIDPGDLVVDLGCGPGYFTLPMAQMVGESGRVIAVDLQPQMLAMVKERAGKAGLSPRISLRHCSTDQLLREPVKADFILAFYMVHEVDNQPRFFEEVRAMLGPGGRLLLAEPLVHVGAKAFASTIDCARRCGFSLVSRPGILFSRTVLLK